MRLSWESLFINGDSSVTPAEFDGLKKRVESGSSQYIDAAGAGLTLPGLDELIDAVDAQGGSRNLIMSKAQRRALTNLARTNTQIDISRNEFGYQQLSYMGVPVIELDRDNLNQDIMGTDDVFCVSFGADLLTGIQNGGVGVRELGESSAMPQLVTRVEWYCGLALVNGRAAARLANIDA